MIMFAVVFMYSFTIITKVLSCTITCMEMCTGNRLVTILLPSVIRNKGLAGMLLNLKLTIRRLKLIKRPEPTYNKLPPR